MPERLPNQPWLNKHARPESDEWHLQEKGSYQLRDPNGVGFDCYTESARELPPYVYRGVSEVCGGVQ